MLYHAWQHVERPLSADYNPPGSVTLTGHSHSIALSPSNRPTHGHVYIGPALLRKRRTPDMTMRSVSDYSKSGNLYKPSQGQWYSRPYHCLVPVPLTSLCYCPFTFRGVQA